MPLPKVVRLVDYVIVSRSHFALSTGALTPVNRLGYNRLDTIMPGLLASDARGVGRKIVPFAMGWPDPCPVRVKVAMSGLRLRGILRSPDLLCESLPGSAGRHGRILRCDGDCCDGASTG